MLFWNNECYLLIKLCVVYTINIGENVIKWINIMKRMCVKINKCGDKY